MAVDTEALMALVAEIDRVTGPDRMTQAQAKAFLEQLVTEIDSRIDGIKDDMRNIGQEEAE